MFYVTIKNTKTSKWEYAHQDMRNTPYFEGNFADALEFWKVDEAINWFGRHRDRLKENTDSTKYDMDSVRVQKVSHSDRQSLRW